MNEQNQQLNSDLLCVRLWGLCTKIEAMGTRFPNHCAFWVGLQNPSDRFWFTILSYPRLTVSSERPAYNVEQNDETASQKVAVLIILI